MVQQVACRQGAVRCSQVWQELLQWPAAGSHTGLPCDRGLGAWQSAALPGEHRNLTQQTTHTLALRLINNKTNTIKPCPSPVLAKAAAHGKAVEGQRGEVIYRSLPQLQRQAAVHHAIHRLLADVRQVRFQAAREGEASRFGLAGSSWRNRMGRGSHRLPNRSSRHRTPHGGRPAATFKPARPAPSPACHPAVGALQASCQHRLLGVVGRQLVQWDDDVGTQLQIDLRECWSAGGVWGSFGLEKRGIMQLGQEGVERGTPDRPSTHEQNAAATSARPSPAAAAPASEPAPSSRASAAS